eukprot:1222024-Amphidinium_carterae.1
MAGVYKSMQCRSVAGDLGIWMRSILCTARGFQNVLLGGSYEANLVADVLCDVRVLGPDAGGHGYDWVMTRERNEGHSGARSGAGQAAPTYEIILSCPLSSSVRVHAICS